MLQQVDAGLIKVLVTRVTNGSSVVSFNLLLAEVDVHHVITTFCEALEHSSYLTINRSSLSIQGEEQEFSRTRQMGKAVINLCLLR